MRFFQKSLLVILSLSIIFDTTSCKNSNILDHVNYKYHKITIWLKTQSFLAKNGFKELIKNTNAIVPAVITSTVAPNIFDKIPTTKDANKEFFFKQRPFKMNIDGMVPAFSEDITEAKKIYPLVRPVPYPFYSVFSVPSDACGSHMSDIYYSQILFQRKYGLDLTSSFFTALDYLAALNQLAIQPSFLDNNSITPFQHPVQLGNELVDNLPAFLTYYYRGWFDHIHSWTSEGIAFISLIQPTTVTGSNTGNAQALTVINPTYSRFDGFDFKFKLQGAVTGFILQLTDQTGQHHYLAVGKPLAFHQQGWEFSLPLQASDVHIYAAIANEKNKIPFNLLGQGIYNFQKFFRNASLTVYGPTNSNVTVKSVRIVPFDRNTVAKQMTLLQQYNILPIVTTNHGGTSSWYQELQLEDDSLKVEYNGTKYDIITPPMGSNEASPTYVSDMFNQFGLLYRSHLSESKRIANTVNSLTPKHFVSEISYYSFPRTSIGANSKYMLTPQTSHAENLGPVLAKLIMLSNHFGLNRILYTHYNFYNKEAFAKLPKITSDAIYMAELKQLPHSTDKALTILAELKYNRSQHLQAYQRIWVAPISTNVRYAAVLRQLNEHTKLTGNTLKITSWMDPVSARQTPDVDNATLDLHGQTFYVPNAATASVELDGKMLTALKRNAKDFTGRESVTVVDLTHPKLFFNKIEPLTNHNAKITTNAEVFFLPVIQQNKADIPLSHVLMGEGSGERALLRASKPSPLTPLPSSREKGNLKLVSSKIGYNFLTIKPTLFDNYETDYFRFVLQKSRPDLQILIGWKGNDNHFFAASSTKLNNNSSWLLPNYQDTQFHDYVVDYSDLRYAANAPLARGPVNAMQIAMLNAKPGDFINIDRIEFLAAPGVKAQENGFVLGGRVLPAQDNIPVTLQYDKQILQTKTERGGWYFFHNIPKDAVVSIKANYQGKDHSPNRGRLIQAHRNDVEYYINL